MVSNPAYDPNSFVAGITLDDWERLSDPKLRPQINRATAAIYPPGSIFKIITGLAGLEAGSSILRSRLQIQVTFNWAIAGLSILLAPGEYNFQPGVSEIVQLLISFISAWRLASNEY